MTNNSIKKNDLKLRWWQPERTNLKKFFQRPKLKLWQIGILVGVLFAGLIGIFYFKDIPTRWVCEGFAAGFWPLCLLLAFGLFFGPPIIGGIICVYIIKWIAEAIRSKKKRDKNTKITILIVVVLTVLVGGGILSWQYFGVPKEKAKIPEEASVDEQKLAEDAVKGYINALMSRYRDNVLPYLTGEAKEKVQKLDISFGTSNPHLGSFEILNSRKLDKNEFELMVREYQEYTGEGIMGYNDETLNVIKVGEKYLISSIKTGAYVDIKETADWKTYRDEEYGFEVKYPGNYEYNAGPLPDIFLFGTMGAPQYDINVWVRSSSQLDKFYENKTEICTEDFLSDKKAYKCEGDKYIYIEAESNGKFYFLSVKGDKLSEKFEVFNQMLSTFKFLEQEPTTANWKTYRNDIYNYELKYPASWYFYYKGDLVYNTGLESCVNGGYRDPKTVLFSDEKIVDCSLLIATHGWNWFSIWVRDLQWSAEELNRTGIVKSEGEYDSECQRELDTTKYEQITFKGLAANKRVALAVNAIGDEPSTQILFNYKDRGWQIIYANDCDGNPLDPAFEQILSTFKFLALL